MPEKAIFERQKLRFRFRDPDMDFIFGWLLGAGVITGLSPGELFHLATLIDERKPKSWRDAFRRHGDFLNARARQTTSHGDDLMAAAFSYRSAIQYTDPTSNDYAPLVTSMEDAFGRAASALHIPLEPIAVPFEARALPGYWIKQERPRATLLVIGGGDSYREDLYYFAGEPGWRRGYDVVMVDLPGQGKLPGEGLTFRPDMAVPISAVVDWLQHQSEERVQRLAIYGISGGGYFSAQAVANDDRLKAWIASTPVIDMARVFAHEFGAIARTPGWLLSLGAFFAGLRDESRKITFRKYAWQFGAKHIGEVVHGAIEQTVRVDTGAIRCPTLMLVGDSESEELKKQSCELHAELTARGVDSTLRSFTAEEGADAHCQVNNFPLAHRVIFDWLDARFPVRA